MIENQFIQKLINLSKSFESFIKLHLKFSNDHKSFYSKSALHVLENNRKNSRLLRLKMTALIKVVGLKMTAQINIFQPI